MPELLRHLRDGFPVQDVIAIMLGDRLLNGLLAGGIGLVGGTLKLQLAVFTGVLGGKSVNGNILHIGASFLSLSCSEAAPAKSILRRSRRFFIVPPCSCA